MIYGWFPQTLHHHMDKILEKYVFFATHLSNFTETENYIIQHYAKNLTVLQQKVRSPVLPKADNKKMHLTQNIVSYLDAAKKCVLFY